MNKGKTYEKGSFGEKLASLINDAGLNKNAFSKELNVSKSYLFDMLNDRTLPSCEMQVKIANTLNLSQKEKNDFYDFTATKKGELPADIVTLVKGDLKMYQKIRQLLQDNKQSNILTDKG